MYTNKIRLVIFWLCLITLVMPSSLRAQQSTATQLKNVPPPAIHQGNASSNAPFLSLPPQVTLCGVPFPLHHQDVYERLDMEFTIAVYGQAQVYLWLKRAGKYFPYIERSLAEAGLPDDLKYLAVAESDLRPHVFSPAKALGTWQFIATTGRRFGLKRDKQFDERLNFEQSTGAAIKYLQKLYAEFNDWMLVMAAYNCGEGCVRREIKEQGVRNYFQLDLPQETERYVYRITAIKIILSNPEKYGYHMPETAKYKPVRYEKVQVNLPADLHFTQVAKGVGTTYKTLREMNPEIKGRYLPRGRYEISVPYGLGSSASAYLNQMAAKLRAHRSSRKTTSSSSGKYHLVKSGDTLTNISKKTGVSISEIKKLNDIKGSHIRIGQKLKLAP